MGESDLRNNQKIDGFLRSKNDLSAQSEIRIEERSGSVVSRQRPCIRQTIAEGSFGFDDKSGSTFDKKINALDAF